MFFIQKSRDGPGDPRLSARIRGGVTNEPDAKVVTVSSSMEPVTTQMSRWLASGGCTEEKREAMGFGKSPENARGLAETPKAFHEAAETQKPALPLWSLMTPNGHKTGHFRWF